MDSNIERLPYLARKLQELTPKIQAPPADPSLLYTFAEPGWKEKLDDAVSGKVKALADDYSHCLTRVRASRQPYQSSKRITDIERILFARGQEDLCDVDSLYAAFSSLTYEEADALYQALDTENWQFLPPEAREDFLQRYLPGSVFVEHYELLCDFRNGGYRILGHLVGDCIASYREKARKALHAPQDSPAMTAMLKEIQEFLDYTTPVTYTAKAKADTTYLRHSTLDFFTGFDGLNRVLTILARGYLFQDGRSDIERARRALLAWSSIPESKKPPQRRSGNTGRIFGSCMVCFRSW